MNANYHNPQSQRSQGTPIGSQRGFGIVEVMVAVMVLAIGVISMTRLHATLLKEGLDAQDRAAVMQFGQAYLEQLRATPFDSIVNEQNPAPTPPLPPVASFGYALNVGAGDPKELLLQLSWQNRYGQDRELTLRTFVSSSSSVLFASDDGAGLGASPRSGPKVAYSPSPSPRVVAVAVGQTIKRETLTPVATETMDNYVHTQFTTYTYDSSTGQLTRREDFQIVACVCRFNGTGEAYRASYPKWDDKQGTYVDVVGDKVTKTVGCVANKQGTGCDTGPNVDPDCVICCRDHHDDADTPRRYDPYRKDNLSGNHAHFNSAGTEVTTGTYLEACRLKRIDGFWRVYQDWFMVSHHVLSLDDLENASNEAIYAAHVASIADTFIDGTDNKTDGDSIALQPLPTALQRGAGNPIAAAVGQKGYLSARGIYVDYIDDAHLAKLKELKGQNKEYLVHLPFYELDVSLVSGWTSAVPNKVRVGPYDGPGNANDLVGGQYQVLAAEANPVRVNSTIRRSNSGLTAFQAIDFGPFEKNYDDATLTASADICAGCSGTPSNACSLPWGGIIAHGDSVLAYAPGSGDSCPSETRTCTNGTLSGSYVYPDCAAANGGCVTPWGTTVANGASVTGYSATNASDCSAVSLTASCVNGNFTPALGAPFIYPTCDAQATCQTTITGTTDKNNDTVSLSVNGGPAITCTVNNNKSYACPAQTTPPTGNTFTLTLTPKNGTPTTKILTESCGAKTVNFP